MCSFLSPKISLYACARSGLWAHSTAIWLYRELVRTQRMCVCVLSVSSAKTFHSSTHISVLMCSSNLLLSFCFTFHQCGQSKPTHLCHCRRSTHRHSLTLYTRCWWQAWKTLHTHTYYCKMYKEDAKYSQINRKSDGMRVKGADWTTERKNEHRLGWRWK